MTRSLIETSRALLPRPVRATQGRRPPTRRLARWSAIILHVAALSLAFAAIVHVLVVLLVPSFAQRDAWAKLSRITRPWNFEIIATPAKAAGNAPSGPTVSAGVVPGLDPRFGVVACRFDLSEGPASIVAEGNVPFWSLAVFDRQGENIYSLNDRTAIGGRLDLIIVDATQRARLRENPVEGLDRSILVNANIKQGFVLVRAFAPDGTWNPTTEAFLRAATCEKLVLPAA